MFEQCWACGVQGSPSRWVIMYAVAHFVFGFRIGTQILLCCDCQMDDSKQSGIDKRRWQLAIFGSKHSCPDRYTYY